MDVFLILILIMIVVIQHQLMKQYVRDVEKRITKELQNTNKLLWKGAKPEPQEDADEQVKQPATPAPPPPPKPAAKEIPKPPASTSVWLPKSPVEQQRAKEEAERLAAAKQQRDQPQSTEEQEASKPVPPPPGQPVSFEYDERSPRRRRREEKKTRTSAEWEAIIGGTWLNRIGAIAVLIATIFFLKYAFDENLIPEWGRVLIGIVVGLGMMIGGDVARRKNYAVFAQGLVGASVPILFLSFYASYEYYQILPHIAAFLGMTAVSALTLYVSLRHEAPFIAAIGAVGGLLTPAFLSTGEINTVGLFSFIAILDVGLLAVAYAKPKWSFINIIVVIGTWGWWAAWALGVEQALEYFELSLQEVRLPGISFAWLFAVGFALYDTLWLKRDKGKSEDLFMVFSMISLVASVIPVYYALHAQSAWQDELNLALFAVFQLGVAWYHYRQEWPPMWSGARIVLAIGVLFMAPAIWREPEVYRTCWALLGGATVFSLYRTKVSSIASLGFLVLMIGLLHVLFRPNIVMLGEDVLPVFNAFTGPLLLLLFAAIASVPPLQRVMSFDSSSTIFSAIRIVATAVVIIVVNVDVVEYGKAMAALAVEYSGMEARVWIAYVYRALSTVLVAAMGIGVMAWGRRINDGALHSTGVTALLGGSVLFLSDVAINLPADHATTLVNLRMGVGILHVVLWVVSYRLSQLQSLQIDSARWKQICGIAIGVLIFALVSTEAADPYQNAQEWNAMHLALSSAWVVYSSVLMWLGFYRRSRFIRIGAITLLGISILKVFLYDLSSLEQPYRIISFIVLGVILLVASYVYSRYKDVILDSDSTQQEEPAEE